jgi:hypothetical protein
MNLPIFSGSEAKTVCGQQTATKPDQPRRRNMTARFQILDCDKMLVIQVQRLCKMVGLNQHDCQRDIFVSGTDQQFASRNGNEIGHK